ncbi:uncharacterized protein LOC134833509 [Culicoides brevitarsis]|uniref:uncharacterized protein LOC134833509 n=1 Tax=Culicoides brevitarsis TaxID=469753 RepID=UPI00307BBA87
MNKLFCLTVIFAILATAFAELLSPEVLIVAPQGRLYRAKRQFRPGGGGFGQSSALANAAAQNQYFGPNGFGGGAAHAQGQAFQSQGPLGGFGASHAGTQTQNFHAGPGGIQGSAGLSGSQAYNLPNGQTIDVAYGGTFSAGPGGVTGGSSNSVGFSG